MHFPADEVQYKRAADKMCGNGRIERVKHGPKLPNLRAVYVKFVNGAHTKWHYHTGEQVLIGIKGVGFVEFRGMPEVKLCKRDRVIIPAGTWHCHGAVKGRNLIHLAVTVGATEWDKCDPCDRQKV